MFTVYAIESLEKTYIYVGMTSNIHKRLSEHNRGKNRSTKAYRPFQIIHTQTLDTRMQARQKEKYLKSGIGKEFLKTHTIAAMAKLVDALL